MFYGRIKQNKIKQIIQIKMIYNYISLTDNLRTNVGKVCEVYLVCKVYYASKPYVKQVKIYKLY